MNTEYCPVCGGPGEVLGALGQLVWHRCINCGMEFYVKTKARKPKKAKKPAIPATGGGK